MNLTDVMELIRHHHRDQIIIDVDESELAKEKKSLKVAKVVATRHLRLAHAMHETTFAILIKVCTFTKEKYQWNSLDMPPNSYIEFWKACMCGTSLSTNNFYKRKARLGKEDHLS